MRWPWQRKEDPSPDELNTDGYVVEQSWVADDEGVWKGSPFNADEIRPGDPGWALFEEAMRTGKVVHGGYDDQGNVWIDRDDDGGIGNE